MHGYHYLPMSDKSIFFFYLIGMQQDFHYYPGWKKHRHAITALRSPRGVRGNRQRKAYKTGGSKGTELLGKKAQIEDFCCRQAEIMRVSRQTRHPL